MPVFSRKQEEGNPPALQIWMDPIEQSQLLAIIHSIAPRRVLEWGAGGSTHFLLQRCPYVESYHSIEHDRGWYEKVRDTLKDPRLSLHHVAPDVPPPNVGYRHRDMLAWIKKAEIDASMFRKYVARAAEFGTEYDFILVDGRARAFCIPAAHALLRPGGVIVVHDAQRTVYHPPLRALGQPVFLEPWKQGQIALLRKEG